MSEDDADAVDSDEIETDANDADRTGDSTGAAAIVAGPDEDDIAAALEVEGYDVTRLEGVVTRPRLEEAGVVEADLYVLTDVGQATSVPIARDLNRELRTVAYDRRRIPEFVKGQLDLAIDPQLADVTMVAQELAGTGR